MSIKFCKPISLKFVLLSPIINRTPNGTVECIYGLFYPIRGLTRKNLQQKIFKRISIVFGLLKDILKVYSNLTMQKVFSDVISNIRPD